ncbi:MAG TPA: phosphatase PAP2 family protein [Gemmatimonadales bacterium]|nr:phosphatase PAP2 family protein [Gemmatimonadales bacterium]
MHPWQRLLTLARNLGRHELGILLAIASLAGLLWGFAELADEVVEGDTEGFDRRLLLALRTKGDLADPIGPRWLEEVGRDFTALGGVGVLVILTGGLAGLLAFQNKLRLVALLIASVGGGLLVSMLLKLAFDRARPDLVPHGSLIYTSSFPSGHSTMAAVTYLTLGAVLMRTDKRPAVKLYLMSIAVFLTIAVGVSRVYLGVHWPTDVLAGWTLGAAWAIICWLTAKWLQRKGRVEPPTAETLP